MGSRMRKVDIYSDRPGHVQGKEKRSLDDTRKTIDDITMPLNIRVLALSKQ